MHSPAIITAMILGYVGVPLSALFLLFFGGSLFFARPRSFAARLLIRSLAAGLLIACAMWGFAQSSLPPPYSYQAAMSGFSFGFGICGFIGFLWFLRKTPQAHPSAPKDLRVAFTGALIVPVLCALWIFFSYEYSNGSHQSFMSTGTIFLLMLLLVPGMLLCLAAWLSPEQEFKSACCGVVIFFAFLFVWLLCLASEGGGMGLPGLAGFELMVAVFALLAVAVQKLIRKLTGR